MILISERIKGIKSCSRLGAFAFLNKVRYNKGDEGKLIGRYYEQAIQNFNKGRISKAVFEGTAGLLGSPEERQRGEHRISSASAKPRTEAPRENLVEQQKAISKQPPALSEKAVFMSINKKPLEGTLISPHTRTPKGVAGGLLRMCLTKR